MRKLILNTLFYLFAGIVLMITVSSIVYNIEVKDAYEHYEDDQISHKINYYKTHKKEFNTLFVGTSRIYRQVDPFLFDSLTGGNTKSYNAAHANLRPYRSYDYIDYLEIDENCKNVFIELIPPSRIGGNYDANPELYSINYHKYFGILDFCINSNYPVQFKGYYALRYTQTFFYKYLGFGLKKYLNLIITGEKAELEPLFYSLDETHGYLPFNKELALQENENLEHRRSNFTKNIQENLKASIRQSQDIELKEKPTMDSYIEDVLALEQKLTKKGINVFYLITPRRKPWDIAYINTIKYYLKGTIIDLCSPDKFPEFYEEQYSFDANHLNHKGAKIFTKRVVESFNSGIATN